VDLTIPAALASAARDFGDAPALAEPGGMRLSYRELAEQAGTVARAGLARNAEVSGDSLAGLDARGMRDRAAPGGRPAAGDGERHDHDERGRAGAAG
jgi:hypothetical protein